MEKEVQPKYELRRTKLDDVEALRKMHADSWLATYMSPENGVSEEWVKERTTNWLTPEAIEKSRQFLSKIFADEMQLHVLAEKDGKIVGFIHVSTKEDGSKYLEGLYTSPETFGTGLGARLMAEADSWMANAPVELEVATYNDRAIRFYEKDGFKLVPGSASRFAETIPTIKMQRGEK